MATLKELLADISTNSTIEFRINDKTSADGTKWANGWVENNEGKLLCVGTTLETLERLEANPDIDNLMLTKPEARSHSSNGLEYDMCQLYILNSVIVTEPNNKNKIQDNLNTKTIEKDISLKLNLWQKNIYIALKNEGSFDLKMLNIIIESDDTGIEFMQHIAYHKRSFEYLSGFNLVNTGFCPITGKKIDGSFNYSIFDRTIYLSGEASEIGKEKKQKFDEQFQKENPKYETNLKQAKSFLENTSPYIQKPKFDNFTFFGALFLSGYLSYKLVKPESAYGYLLVIIMFILTFSAANWIRKKI